MLREPRPRPRRGALRARARRPRHRGAHRPRPAFPAGRWHAPTTADGRLAAIGAQARGFLYTVSVAGTTGERAALDSGLAGIIARAHAATAVPVALGFGIATGEQARAAADAGADGVIVGSRLVRAALEADDPPAAVHAAVAELAAALER